MTLSRAHTSAKATAAVAVLLNERPVTQISFHVEYGDAPPNHNLYGA